MNKMAVVSAETEAEAVETCNKRHKWTPDTARVLNINKNGTKLYVCFENTEDAEHWENQK